MNLKPATPLPWTVRENLTLDANLGGFAFPYAANTHYIAHACNAYPKLVEALREACGRIRRYGAGAEDFASLLSELGEKE